EYVPVYFIEEPLHLVLCDHRPGGVIRVGYEDGLRFRRDAGVDVLEVVCVARHGRDHRRRPREPGHYRVDDEGVLPHDGLVPGAEERPCRDVDDVVRAVTEYYRP